MDLISTRAFAVVFTTALTIITIAVLIHYHLADYRPAPTPVHKPVPAPTPVPTPVHKPVPAPVPSHKVIPSPVHNPILNPKLRPHTG